MDLRPLRRDEMAAAAAVHRASFDERLPWLAGRYSPAQDACYFAEHVFPRCSVWGAFSEQSLVAILAFRLGWIDQLYVLPQAQGAGIGASLLEIAKARQTRLRLWTFERNVRARVFYEKRGFVALRRSNGSRNTEREPDILYQWRPVE